MANFTSTIETKTIETLLTFSQEGTFFISDITNTLYKPGNMMSDKKGRSFFAKIVSEVIPDPDTASKVANSIENMIVNKIDKLLVDENTPRVIRQLQKNNPYLAITMKSWAAPYDPQFGITTSDHLKKLDIDLEKSIQSIGKMKKDESSDYEVIPSIIETSEYTFARGIIFTQKKPLDIALDAFLKRLQKKPKQIVIFENSIVHKDKLEAVIRAHNIGIIFVRHQLLDSTSFDPILGAIEFLKFMKDSQVILDTEAQTIRDGNSSVDYVALLKTYIEENKGLFLKE